MKAFFISDLHLGAREIENFIKPRGELQRFFEYIASEATHLFIVGDFFDFWFEYRYVIPKHFFPVLHFLMRLREKNIEIYYLAGNHDFALGNFFTQYLGMHISLDHLEIDLGGKRFYLFHGDGLDTKDVGYRLLKKVLRNRINQKLFRWLHPDLGIKLADLVSGTSRKYTSEQIPPVEKRVDVRFAEQQFTRGIDFVLMGHCHMPIEYNVGEKKYINLGDWITNNSYAVFDGRELGLHYWK